MSRFRSFTIVFLLLIVSHAQAQTFTTRYKLDTLFHLGTHEAMEYKFDFLTRLLEQRGNKDKKMAAEWLALICENVKAMGLYKPALDYGEVSEQYYKELINDPANRNNIQLIYDYSVLCHDLAGLHSTLMISYDKAIHYYLKSVELMGEWTRKMPPFTAKAFDYHQYDMLINGALLLEKGSMMLSMLSHNYGEAALHADTLLFKIEEAYPQMTPQRFDYNYALLYKAAIYSRAQNFEETLRYINRAKENITKYYGTENLIYAYALYLEASAYYQLNDHAKTDHLIAQCLQIYNSTGHTLHADHAEAMELAGHFMLNFGNYKTAAQLYDSALEVIKTSCGDDCFHVSLNRAFTTYPMLFEKRYDEGIKIMEEVLQNERFISNMTDDHVISAISDYFELSYLSGQFNNVFNHVKDAEDIISQMGDNVGLGVINKLYITVGRTYQANSRHFAASPYFYKALNSLRTMAHNNFSFLPETQRVHFWDSEHTRFESILQQNEAKQADGTNEIASLLYDAALLQKGLLLNASVNMSRIIEEKAPESLKQKMRKLQLKLQSSLPTEEAKNECLRLEKEVQNEARLYGDFMDFTDLTWRDILRVLKPSDVAIEFVTSEHSNMTTLSAEILTGKKRTPTHVKLLSYNKNTTSDEQLRQNVLQLIEQKVLPFLKPGDKVYFSPAGLLHTMPIEYMQLSNGKRIDQIYQMYRLSSTRQLVSERESADSSASSLFPLSLGKAGSIALFGGMNYNSTIDERDMQLAMADQSRSLGNNPLHSQFWPYLSNTMDEVTDISTLMNPTNYHVRLFTGDEGLEENFKSLSESRTSIIHIATHGYYEDSASVDMNNAGLIFSGANNYSRSSATPTNGIDDGILKASEISNLNLIGTDLVVLSACQTGLGNITGEGVFGLQRAFKKAGVQSLLMSLWKVDDEATKVLMTSFYRNLLKGHSKHKSLQLAQADVCARTFHLNGLPVSGSDPHFWAAFILID